MNDSDFLLPHSLGGPVIDTTNCEREPIHLPGSIQSHGALLVVGAREWRVLQASRTVPEFLGFTVTELLGQPLAAVLGEDEAARVRQALPDGTPDNVQYRSSVHPAERPELACTAHRSGDLVILEFEPGRPALAGPNVLRNALYALENASSLAQLLHTAARVIREITGLDRVMLYRFDQDANGEVVAEERRADLHPYLGHRFPESDIPAQARALYVQHLLRLTADVDAPGSPLEPLVNPLTGKATPLGGAVLRSTSPMHLLYLKNMGVQSSLSVSIVVDGRLWGLISCHHHQPHVVSPETRTELEYLGRVLNLQVRLKARQDIDQRRAQLESRRNALIGAAAHTLHPEEALTRPDLDLPALLQATGAVVFTEGQVRTLGTVPPPDLLAPLIEWLRTQPDDFVSTDSLPERWSQGRVVADVASGLLAFNLGTGWSEGVLWLRPEVPQTIAWGGAPPGMAKDELGPRRSFQTYIETVKWHALPWDEAELEEAAALQQALIGMLGERLSEMKRLNRALETANEEWRRYAFVISHDLQEPLRLILQFAELFQLRFEPQVGPDGARLIQFMTTETRRLQTLTRDLYTYTELLSGPQTPRRTVALDELWNELLAARQEAIESGGVSVTAGPLPRVPGDRTQLKTLLDQLFQNALTFRSDRPPQIRVWADARDQGWDLHVQDNGAGIAPEYHQRVFQVFQRLGPRTERSGNGLGLALVAKIAELHGGRVELDSVPGQGSTFTVFFPGGPVTRP